MFRELWDAFCEWASEAWNWIKNFFTKVWERIISWYSALCDYIEKWLNDEDDEAVIIDPTSDLGKQIKILIDEKQPEKQRISRYNKNGMLALHFDGDGELKEVANFEAKTVDQIDDFERDLQKKGGVLRLTI